MHTDVPLRLSVTQSACCILIIAALGARADEIADPVSTWLLAHSDYRAKIEEDCLCTETLAAIRNGTDGWSAQASYQPYAASGDFNSDGLEDRAVLVVLKKRKDLGTLLVFNGVTRSTYSSNPAFEKEGVEGALFYGEPRPKPWRLVVGTFNSEGVVLEPKSGGYRLVESED